MDPVPHALTRSLDSLLTEIARMTEPGNLRAAAKDLRLAAGNVRGRAGFSLRNPTGEFDPAVGAAFAYALQQAAEHCEQRAAVASGAAILRPAGRAPARVLPMARLDHLGAVR